MFDNPYYDIGLMKEIASDLQPARHTKYRSPDREREPRDHAVKKKKAAKMAKASRRRNRRTS